MLNFVYPDFIKGRGAVGLLLLRIVAGAALVQHGWPKIQNASHWMGAQATVPAFLQALAAVSEFGGGLALIIGLLTPIAAFGIACTMAVAILTVHLPHGDAFVGKPGTASFESAAGYLAVALMFILVGPGMLSFDAAIFGPQRRYFSLFKSARVHA
jgi:putative oxidoreductase